MREGKNQFKGQHVGGQALHLPPSAVIRHHWKELGNITISSLWQPGLREFIRRIFFHEAQDGDQNPQIAVN